MELNHQDTDTATLYILISPYYILYICQSWMLLSDLQHRNPLQRNNCYKAQIKKIGSSKFES